MFQYAAGKILGQQLRREVKVDPTFFGTDKKGVTKRKLHLDLFKGADGEYISCKSDSLFRKTLFKIKYPFLKASGHTLILRNIDKKNTQYYQKFKNILLDGYFHDLDLLRTNEMIVSSIFEFHERIVAESRDFLNVIRESNSVSLHIRRGDYTSKENQSIYHTCAIAYYKEAINQMRSQLKNPSFFVFSDDLQWARKALKLEKPVTFIDVKSQNKDAVEFFLMSSCRHHIIANSTYSWWAAYLKEYEGQMVIAPNSWFKDEVQNVKTLELIPSTWKLL